MKKVILGLALATIATGAFAGALIDPIVEPQIIVEKAAASSINHAIIPLVFFAMFVGVVFMSAFPFPGA